MVSAVFGLTFLSGCRPPLKFAAPKKAQVKKDPPNIQSKGITVNWFEKQKDGKLLKSMDLEAQTGTLIAGKQSGIMRMTHGIIYKM